MEIKFKRMRKHIRTYIGAGGFASDIATESDGINRDLRNLRRPSLGLFMHNSII
jgi:hypothetical protein